MNEQDARAIIELARSWRQERDEMVSRHQIAATSFAATPGVSQRTFLDSHNAYASRMMLLLPTMDPADFEAFRELVSAIPAILAQRERRG